MVFWQAETKQAELYGNTITLMESGDEMLAEIFKLFSGGPPVLKKELIILRQWDK